MRRDAPAFVAAEVRRAVWRWRWRRLEGKHPCLSKGGGGFGPFLQPIFRLLASKPEPEFGPKQQGALRSAVADRQWPQARLKNAGKVVSATCRLCVNLGFCAPDDPDPRYSDTLLHRIWTCPALESERARLVPEWLRTQVWRALREDGSMDPGDLLFFTRALAPSPEASLPTAPQDETFEWVVHPGGDQACVHGKFYIDGSMLDAEWKLAGCCARRGWAFAAVNDLGEVVASAHGRPPAWTGGINGAELWGLLMAAQIAFPEAEFRVDCQAVQVGAQKGSAWATAPHRELARAWGPLSSALGSNAKAVVWMPAHCITGDIGMKKLSDGTRLSWTSKPMIWSTASPSLLPRQTDSCRQSASQCKSFGTRSLRLPAGLARPLRLRTLSQLSALRHNTGSAVSETMKRSQPAGPEAAAAAMQTKSPLVQMLILAEGSLAARDGRHCAHAFWASRLVLRTALLIAMPWSAWKACSLRLRPLTARQDPRPGGASAVVG